MRADKSEAHCGHLPHSNTSLFILWKSCGEKKALTLLFWCNSSTYGEVATWFLPPEKCFGFFWQWRVRRNRIGEAMELEHCVFLCLNSNLEWMLIQVYEACFRMDFQWHTFPESVRITLLKQAHSDLRTENANVNRAWHYYKWAIPMLWLIPWWIFCCPKVHIWCPSAVMAYESSPAIMKPTWTKQT